MPIHQCMVYNLSQPLKTTLRARYCTTFLCRLRGLTFRKPLPLDEGLLLIHDRESRVDTAIHMLGVRMNLTVVWINSADKIVDVRLARPWRLVYIPKQAARNVLELHASRYNEFKVGDVLRFESI